MSLLSAARALFPAVRRRGNGAQEPEMNSGYAPPHCGETVLKGANSFRPTSLMNSPPVPWESDPRGFYIRRSDRPGTRFQQGGNYVRTLSATPRRFETLSAELNFE